MTMGRGMRHRLGAVQIEQLWQAWQAGGLPVSDEPPVPRRADFIGGPGQMPIVSVDELASRLARPDCVLIDVRSRARYAGLEEPIDPVAGHVPGAVNAPFQGGLSSDGRFRAAQDIAQAFATIVRDPAKVVMMCGSGVTACHGLFALELLCDLAHSELAEIRG